MVANAVTRIPSLVGEPELGAGVGGVLCGLMRPIPSGQVAQVEQAGELGDQRVTDLVVGVVAAGVELAGIGQTSAVSVV